LRFRGLGVVASVSLAVYACFAVAFFLITLTGEKTEWQAFIFRLIFFFLIYLVARAFPGKFSDDVPSPRLTAGRVAIFVAGFLALIAGFVIALYTFRAASVAGTILSLIACTTIFCDVLEKRWRGQDARRREEESAWWRSKGIHS
jgi:peptidoglycan/LPS O-acetylase OafA/YrhL